MYGVPGIQAGIQAGLLVAIEMLDEAKEDFEIAKQDMLLAYQRLKDAAAVYDRAYINLQLCLEKKGK
jgi:hypothetical protein